MKVDRLVLWDIDGTLLHCGSDGKKALNHAFHELYGIADAFEHAAIGGAMDSALINHVHETHGIDELRKAQFQERYRAALEEILSQNQEKKVLPGVLGLLNHLNQEPSVVNALLTSNLQVGAQTKLDAFDLKQFFLIGGYGDEPGEKWDVANRCIESAEREFHTNFRRDKIFLIGDSCYDITAAKVCGIKSIAVSTGWADAESLNRCKPDHFFSDLTQTDQILSVLMG